MLRTIKLFHPSVTVNELAQMIVYYLVMYIVQLTKVLAHHFILLSIAYNGEI
jgi:hypothetical protein